MSRLIKIYSVCHSVFAVQMKHLFTNMYMSKSKDVDPDQMLHSAASDQVHTVCQLLFWRFPDYIVLKHQSKW